ncbi:NAD-dependent malate dehydrogenase [Trichophyton rubrum]|uniref:malate dehydrogenase n=1 Tax=Trichophyton rubrum TaxID=5551 RepID=A0A178F8P0_TRIRU|nr:NAD-dependent malate dehydrogenase [Trichophyton rubrum]
MVKAAVLGASGGIGQTNLRRYKKTSGYLPKDEGLKNALTGCELVLIPAGIPRKPGMTRDDLFTVNAGIVRDLVHGVAEFCPKAFVLIISNPVNSTVPIAAEVLKKAGVFDAKRLFGVTTLDILRAETFAQKYTGEKNPSDATIHVIGGHSGETIVPVYSLAKPVADIPESEYAEIIKRVQFGGDEVVKAKDSAGSATLSMAYAGYRFALSVMKAAKGEKGIVEPTFVHLSGINGGDVVAKETGLEYFSMPVELGPSGAENIVNILPNVNEREKALLEVCKSGLQGNIAKGISFVQNPPQK